MSTATLKMGRKMMRYTMKTDGEKWIRLVDARELITDAYNAGFQTGLNRDLASHPEEYANFALMEAVDESEN